MIFINPRVSYAQAEQHVFQEWSTFKGTQDMYHRTKTISDSDRNVYVLGSSINVDGDYDIMVVKYDRKGNLLWEDFIDGSAHGDDIGTDLILDSSNKLIITGTVVNTGSAHDLILKKYNANGTSVWTKFYNGSANLIDGGTSLAIGSSNQIYVGGGTYDGVSQSDFLILKYSNTGTILWSQTYNYVNKQEVVAKIAYNGGTLIVSGISEVLTGKWEIASLKMNSINGNIIAVYRTGGSAESIDRVTDVVTDNNENIYIVGGVKNLNTDYDMKIVKLDEDLNLLWTKEIDGAGDDDIANAVKVDNNGNVYVTGYTLSDNLLVQAGAGMNDLTQDGFWDGYVLELSSQGTFNSAYIQSYIGGSGVDVCNSVDFQPLTGSDPISRLYITGNTDSDPSSFPIQNNGGNYNQGELGGQIDGFIMLLDENNTNTWCTYFGSDKDDIITDISTDYERLVVVGSTRATSVSTICGEPINGGFPICQNSGGEVNYTYEQSNGNFIAEFVSDNLVWSTFVDGVDIDLSRYIHYDPSVDIGSDRGIYFCASTSDHDIEMLESPFEGSFNIGAGVNGSGYISRYNFIRQLTWKTYLAKRRMRPFSLKSYNYNGQTGVILVGYAKTYGQDELVLSSNCEIPDSYEYAYCDNNGLNYTEINDNQLDVSSYTERMYLMFFNNFNVLKWATYFGEDRGTYFSNVTLSKDRMIAVGLASQVNTLEDFDTGTNQDYYRTGSGDDSDGSIAMFELGTVCLDVNGLIDAQKGSVSVSPNPFDKELNLTLNDVNCNSIEIELINAQGKIVLREIYKYSGEQIVVNTSGLSSGFYVLNVYVDDDKSFHERVIKH